MNRSRGEGGAAAKVGGRGWRATWVIGRRRKEKGKKEEEKKEKKKERKKKRKERKKNIFFLNFNFGNKGYS